MEEDRLSSDIRLILLHLNKKKQCVHLYCYNKNNLIIGSIKDKMCMHLKKRYKKGTI